jgi:hypothetical protein
MAEPEGTPPLMCRSCLRELLTEQDIHRIEGHGPFCAACAASARGMTFAEWLDATWRREHPN